VNHDFLKIIVGKNEDDNTRKVRRIFVQMEMLEKEFGKVDFDDKIDADFKNWKSETGGSSIDVFIDYEIVQIAEKRESIIKMTEDIPAFNKDTSSGRWDYLKSNRGFVAMDEYKKFLMARMGENSAWMRIGEYGPDDVQNLYGLLLSYSVFEKLSREKFYRGFTEYRDGQVLKVAKGKGNAFMNFINFTGEKLFGLDAELRLFLDSFGGSVTAYKFFKKKNDRADTYRADSIKNELQNMGLI